MSQFNSIQDLAQHLRTEGCRRCTLGMNPVVERPCVYRGNPNNSVMLVSEAPGKIENLTGKPYTGPAGKLLDSLFYEVGIDTNNF
jgi:DNA polymerase